MTALSNHFLAVERDTFKLRHYRRTKVVGKWKLKGVYDVTLGAVGHATPRGLFEVTNKTTHPDWRKPFSDWVPLEERGELVPFLLPDGTENPANPFKGGFISLWDGVGIHGTKFDPQLGTRSSHGCIRVGLSTFLDLYEKIAIGTPVYIF